MSIVPSSVSLERLLTQSEKAEFDKAISGIREFLKDLPSQRSSQLPLPGSLLKLKDQIEQLSNDSAERRRGQAYELRDMIKELDTDCVPLESWKPGLLRMTNFANHLQVRYTNPTLDRADDDAGRSYLDFKTYQLDDRTGNIAIANHTLLDPHNGRVAQTRRSVKEAAGYFFQNTKPEKSEYWAMLSNVKHKLRDLRSNVEKGSETSRDGLEEVDPLTATTVLALEAFEHSVTFAGISLRTDPSFAISVSSLPAHGRGGDEESMLSEADSKIVAQGLKDWIDLLQRIWDKPNDSASRGVRVVPAVDPHFIIAQWNPKHDKGQAVKRLASWQDGTRSSKEDFRILHSLAEQTAGKLELMVSEESHIGHNANQLKVLVKWYRDTDESLQEPKQFVKSAKSSMNTLRKAIKEVSGISMRLAVFNEIDDLEDGLTNSSVPSGFLTMSVKDVVRQRPAARVRLKSVKRRQDRPERLDPRNTTVFDDGATLILPRFLSSEELQSQSGKIQSDLSLFFQSLNESAVRLRPLKAKVTSCKEREEKRSQELGSIGSSSESQGIDTRETQGSGSSDIDLPSREYICSILATIEAALEHVAVSEETKASSASSSAGGKRKRAG